jgi:nucleotide-binding universal stress UspA family protein
MRLDSELTILHVCEILMLPDGATQSSTDLHTPLAEAAEKELESLHARIAPRVARIKTECSIGFPREAILARAEALGADLIVMGTHGRKGSLTCCSGALPSVSFDSRACRFSQCEVRHEPVRFGPPRLARRVRQRSP